LLWFHAFVGWTRRHRTLCLCLILLLGYLALCLAKGTTFALTHFGAQNCGELQLSAGVGTGSSSNVLVQQAAACFAHAHQQCQPAILRAEDEQGISIVQTELSTASALGGCQLTFSIQRTDHAFDFSRLAFWKYLFPWNVLDPQEKPCQSVTLHTSDLELAGCQFPTGTSWPSVQWLRWAPFGCLRPQWGLDQDRRRFCQ
jgi:hypothetical protein